MRRTLKILRWLALILIVILLLGGSGGYLYFRHSLPTTSGTIQVAGIQGRIEIIRDLDSVPHIYAQTPADAFFGLGYVHAQDRLWQMEYQRRIAQGRLSEIFGDQTLTTDQFLRTLSVYRAATSAWATLPAQDQATINAYVAGINAFIATHSGAALPPEFTLLGVTPEAWTGPDILAWLKVMAFDLGGNYWTELFRREVVQTVGPQRAGELLPGYPEDGASILTASAARFDYDGLLALDGDFRRLMGIGTPNGEGLGSNNWVVDPTKSTTGAPILANDPHLESRIPSIWYLAHLSAGDLDVIGATIPGLPAVIIGRNQSIAWGMTNTDPDVQDLFHERLDPSGQLVEFQGRLEPLRVFTETIQVKDAAAVQHVVRATRHGPLISEAINAQDAERPPEQRRPALDALALRWTAIDEADASVSSLLAINRAQNWEEFQAALRPYVAPVLNFVYADVRGNIGYYAPGRVPVRASGDGSLPAEGWTGAAEWQGWIPFEAMPHALNPSDHMLVTANNRPVLGNTPYFLGRDWAPPYRAQRISDLLRARPQLSPADHQAIQGDTVSLYARELLPALLPLVTPADDRERQAIALLTAWDGDTAGASAAAAIFETWVIKLTAGTAADELGPLTYRRYQGLFSFVSRFLVTTFRDPGSPWCDNVTTPAAENCATAATLALREALAELTDRLGPNIDGWRWDALHTVMFPHQPFETVPVLGSIFNRSVPNGGDSSTVNLGHVAYDPLFAQYSVAGYRQIIDLSAPDAGVFIQATGQSGHVLSAEYADYIEDWQAVRYRPMRFSRARVEQDQQAVLQLEPLP
jgi:penicillin amidase